MITYIIKSGLCLALILFVYKVLLERERMYKFNRYYLLLGLCFALVVPFITMEVPAEIPVAESTNIINFEEANFAEAIPFTDETTQVTPSISIWIYVFAGLYVIGYLVFFLRFMNNIYQIFYKITRNTKAFYKKASLVLLHENILPHTFLHYIFIKKEAYDTATIAEELYTHELAHVDQKHTLDIILIELIQIVFWFNPLLIYYKKAIQLNHEFLADDAVLKSNIQIPTYQQLLLDNASWNHNLYLASNLNFSVTKKRLQMMTKHTSQIRAWLFASLTIPIFIGALFLFSTKVAAKETTAEIIKIPAEETSITTKFDPKAAYYKNVTFIFEDENGKKVSKKYAQLTEEEKENLRQPPKTPVAKHPTTKLLNDWKDKKGFAIWIDGKVTENTKISNYTIVHYTGSRVAKNARSKRFPQLYQMHLYTAAGFEKFKEEITNPLGERVIIHIKKGKHGKKVGATTPKVLTAKEALAEANALPVNYINENTGPNEINLPVKEKENGINGKKDIIIQINKNGKFLVNYKHACDLNELDKFIKVELAKILHKKARSGLIIYDGNVKDKLETPIANAKKALRKFKIYNVNLMSSADIPPPPPPAPKAPTVIEVEVKGHKAPASKKPTVKEIVVKGHKAPAPKKPVVIEVKETVTAGNVSKKEAKAIRRMHQNIKGHKVTKMTINGKEHFYIIKNGRKYIYNEKNQLVDENGKLLPPPPPPPPKPGKKDASKWKDGEYHAGHTNIDGETFYYTIKDGKKTFYNRFGKVVDENGKVLPPPPPPPMKVKDAPKVAKVSEKERKAGYMEINGETYYYTTKDGKKLFYNRFGKPVDKNGKVLPPPPPKKKMETGKTDKKTKSSGLVGVKHVPDYSKNTRSFPTINAGNIVAHVKVMNRHNAVFYFNEKRITYREALRMVRKNKNLHVYSQFETEKASAFVKLTES